MKAKIFEIKRFAVHDGDGIRTTVFFKGCPLECAWCHNPEGIGFKPQLAYYEEKCVNCGNCVKHCPENAHTMKRNIHFFDRQKCTACGKCVEMCFGNALSLFGKETTVSELLLLLLEDKEFYDSSGGGVTLSGGECLVQADFCAALLKELKANGIHTAVDTCGFVSKEDLDKVMSYTDIFLYDLKAYDDDVHIKCTGKSNKIIIENLKYIDSLGKPIEIRIPYVPHYNSNQLEKIIKLLKEIKNLTKVKVLPYHNYAGSKYEALEMKNTLPSVLPKSEELEGVVNMLRREGINAE